MFSIVDKTENKPVTPQKDPTTSDISSLQPCHTSTPAATSDDEGNERKKLKLEVVTPPKEEVKRDDEVYKCDECERVSTCNLKASTALQLCSRV